MFFFVHVAGQSIKVWNAILNICTALSITLSLLAFLFLRNQIILSRHLELVKVHIFWDDDWNFISNYLVASKKFGDFTYFVVLAEYMNFIEFVTSSTYVLDSKFDERSYRKQSSAYAKFSIIIYLKSKNKCNLGQHILFCLFLTFLFK